MIANVLAVSQGQEEEHILFLKKPGTGGILVHFLMEMKVPKVVQPVVVKISMLMIMVLVLIVLRVKLEWRENIIYLLIGLGMIILKTPQHVIVIVWVVGVLVVPIVRMQYILLLLLKVVQVRNVNRQMVLQRFVNQVKERVRLT